MFDPDANMSKMNKGTVRLIRLVAVDFLSQCTSQDFVIFDIRRKNHTVLRALKSKIGIAKSFARLIPERSLGFLQ